MQPRLDVTRHSPGLIKKFQDFGLSITRDAGLDPDLAQLIDIRASQLNGCAFCLDMHVKQAKIRGERELRLHHVAIWRESPLFGARERAALAWTEALTHLSPTGVSDETYTQAREQFSERELSDLTFGVMAINGWNRMAVAFRVVPGSQDQAFGLEKAALA
ncbi:MAG TPA: carboxymuconolactone decarboxylase family protein [Burkholderiaceae bacterium]|nr:carboxymuconolactone decarboxylase family protein [Burkholderiaceae bacterium]